MWFSFSKTRRLIASNFCMMIGNRCSLDQWTSDFPTPLAKILKAKNWPKFDVFFLPYLTLCARTTCGFVHRQIFRKRTTLCQSTMFCLRNDTDVNNLTPRTFCTAVSSSRYFYCAYTVHCSLFAVAKGNENDRTALWALRWLSDQRRHAFCLV